MSPDFYNAHQDPFEKEVIGEDGFTQFEREFFAFVNRTLEDNNIEIDTKLIRENNITYIVYDNKHKIPVHMRGYGQYGFLRELGSYKDIWLQQVEFFATRKDLYNN